MVQLPSLFLDEETGSEWAGNLPKDSSLDLSEAQRWVTPPRVSEDSSAISICFTLLPSRGFCFSQSNPIVVVFDLAGS